MKGKLAFALAAVTALALAGLAYADFNPIRGTNGPATARSTSSTAARETTSRSRMRTSTTCS
jgi:hypothetical protein